MGRPKKDEFSVGALSLAEIERMLRAAEAAIAEKQARRAALLAELETLDAELAVLLGDRSDSGRREPPKEHAVAGKPRVRKSRVRRSGKSAARGPRAEGESLVDYLRNALAAAGGPMPVAELRQAVLDAGYPTKSKTFGVIVTQRLADMEDVEKLGRGVYALKQAKDSGAAKERTAE